MGDLTISTANTAADKPPRRKRSIPVSLQVFVGILVFVSIGAVWIVISAYRQGRAIEAIQDAGGSIIPQANRSPSVFEEVIGRQRGLSFDDVEVIVFSRSSQTDAVVPNLQRLSRLRYLDVSDSQITDVGLGCLATSSNLEWLNLDGTAVTDVGLSSLTRLKRLKLLSLEQTRITDRSLAHLRRIPSLKRLFLRNTDVTDAGLRSLQAALPQCRITR